MSGMAHEMPMRYAVSSHQTTRPSREYDAGCGIERADELTLELESYKMPVKRAGQETISGAIFFIERELRAHADTIRFIRADESKDGNRINGFLHVTAQYNTCACPYCGNETALLHDQWRVLLDKHTDLPIVKSHVNSNGASIRLAKYPAENLPLGGSRFEPIESMKGQVSKPYGHGCRLPFEEFDMWRHQLVLSRDLLEDRDSTTRTFGMSEITRECTSANDAANLTMSKSRMPKVPLSTSEMETSRRRSKTWTSPSIP